LLLPAYTVVVLLFLMLPIVVMIPVSFNATGEMGLTTTGPSLRWYHNVARTPQFARGFLTSVVVAVISTLVSLVAGSLAAYGLTRYRVPGSVWLNAAFTLPLIFPAVSYGVAMLMFLAPLKLTRTVTGLVMAHVVLTMPYVFRTVGATLQGLDRSLEEAAQSLGADRVRTLRHIVFPLAKPGLIAGATFSLIMSFDEFTVSLFLVGGKATTLPLEIYHYVEYIIDPTVAAISTLLILLSGGVVWLVERLVGLQKHFQV
jgi:putative spermidine/putrescine transport system permease protein